MKKSLFALIVVCLALVMGSRAAFAQTEDLQLTLGRNIGFSLGSQIQGSFTLGVTGPEGLSAVTFLLDGQEMATVSQAPFRYTFSTESYTVGPHQFSATAKTSGGATLKSNVIDAEIVSSSAGMQTTLRLIGPIIGIVLVVVAAMVALQVLPLGRNRRKFEPGAVRNYGAAGGAICPKCGRPFARSVLSMNLFTGKLERCPYCGKWSITRAASPEALRAAEQAEVQGATPAVHELTPEERLRQQIEDSKLSR